MRLERAGMVVLLQAGSRMEMLAADGSVVSQHGYRVTDDGRVLTEEDAKAPGGMVASCRVVNEAGDVLASGTCGLTGSDADVELDHLDIQPGSRVEAHG